MCIGLGVWFQLPASSCYAVVLYASLRYGTHVKDDLFITHVKLVVGASA